ncbi:MAG TPA: glycosyltransferase [Bryobacteraceae bacterium]|nr:glycosyltransferase [Bryobacteraceae bacterium]
MRTASLLHYLARSYSVDLIVFRQPGEPDPGARISRGLAERVSIIDLPAHRRGGASRSLRNAIRLARRVPPLIDRFSRFEHEVARAVENQEYAVGIIEHFWCAPYWDQISPVCRHTVLDLHNIESVLHERCAQVETGAAGLAHRLFAQASAKLERKWFPYFSEVLVPSETDAKQVLTLANQAHVIVYPNAIPLPPLPTPIKEDAIVFSGNLEYHPNISAVRFFRREVWPQLRERWPGLVWRLIGKNPQGVAQWTAGDPRIELSGPVDDAVAELARCKIAVVPVLAASGTRLKILEAWAAGLPVVSTTLGAEGLPVVDGQQILLADSALKFTEATARLLENEGLRASLGRAGRLLLEDQFTWEKAWENLHI